MTEWRVEAQGVCKDIGNHVRDIAIKHGDEERIFLDVTTLENKYFSVELSTQGFRVVDVQTTEKSGGKVEFFETPYSLLASISPSFNQSFSAELIEKLNKLKDI